MHSIERYGVIALIFLGGTVLAVLMWDRGSDEPAGGKDVLAAGKSTSGPLDVEKKGSAKAEPASRRRPTPRADRGKEDDVVRGQARTSSRPVRRNLEPRTPPAAETKTPAAFTSPGPRPSSTTLAELRGESDAADPLANLLEAEPESTKPVGKRSTTGTPKGKGNGGGKALRRGGAEVYVVKSGDTLSEISLAVLGTSKRWKEIIDANPGLDPKRMVVGARLKMPSGAKVQSGGQSSSGSPDPAKPKAKAKAEGTYVVGSGDSLWKIAQRTLGDGERWKEIAELNPSIDANKLLVGAKLVLPAGAKADAPRKKTSSSGALVAKGESEKKRGRVR